MAFLRSVSAAESGPVVYGDGVMLRIPVLADYPAWAELRAASREFLRPWEPAWADDELSRGSFRRHLRHYQTDLRDDTGYAFFVHDENGNQLLGGLTLTNVRRGVTQSCSLGYWTGAPHACKGHMGRAVRAIIPFAFNTLNLHRIEAACLTTNAASIKVLEKSGFQREGLARRYLKINGIWQDHLLFGLLVDDQCEPNALGAGGMGR